MPTDPIITVSPVRGKYTPFSRSSISTDWSALSEFYGTVEAVALVKNAMYITYQFDGAETVSQPGFRAGGWGIGIDPGFRWLSFITGISGGCTAANLFTMPFGVGQTDWQYKPTAALDGVTPGSPGFLPPSPEHPEGVSYAKWTGEYGWEREINEGSIRKWYTWGIRKFWLHLPFGKTPRGAYTGTVGGGGAAFCPDPLMYQPDQYICAKEGFVDAATGRTGNIPMPWLTDDTVDGKVQGFVPLFKALISGSSAGLSQEVWERLTGENTEMGMWFNPADPIEVTVYNGTINGETYARWRRWFNAKQSVLPDTEGLPAEVYARRRLEKSLEPFALAGMRIGFDALPVAPGSTVGINGTNGSFSTKTVNTEQFTAAYNIPPGTTFGEADAGWWKFFSEWVIPTFGKKNIFMEAIPGTFVSSGITQMNPYVLIGGINVCTADEYGRAGFGGTSSSPSFVPTTVRHHYLEELGDVEYLNSLVWAPTKPHVGSVDTSGVTLLNGKYWYLSALAEKPGIKFDNGEAYHSGLSPQPITSTQMAQGADYLRLKRSFAQPGNPDNSVPGEHIWGHYWAADHLAHRHMIGNGYTFDVNGVPFGVMGDPNPITKDKTRPGILFPFSALKETSFEVMPGVTAFGITNDFQRAFGSGITAFARFVSAIKSGKLTLDPLKSNTGLNTITFPITTTEAVQTVAGNLALESRIEGIGGVMWLYPSDYDRYCSTALGGTLANGSFHVPNTTEDIVERKLEQWLDMKIRTWYERFGKYPKYMTWKLPEYSGRPNNNQINWEMMRFLQYPSRIPTTAVETSAAIGVREGYHSKPPDVASGLLVNSGFGSSIAFNGSVNRMYPDLSSNYSDSVFEIVPLLQLTKAWRTKRGLGAKVGLYQFPFLPQDAYAVYGVSGSSAVVLDSGGWNDLVFPKGNTSTSDNGGGTFGWYTLAETVDLKNRIKLEYRKRYEPVAKECEVVMPEIFEYSSKEIINDDKNEYYRAWHRELLNLAFDLKTKRAWDVTNNADNPPALLNAEIIPVITPAYMGVSGDLVAHDPLTIQSGTLFDHDKMNFNSIDWIRDEYLRPIQGTPQKIQGMSVWSPYLSRALNASKLGTVPTTDRAFVLKWLTADQGAGATIDWFTNTDVKTKTIQFFDVHRNLSKRYLKRFDLGQPRIDVLNPYKHTVFAVGWNAGYSGSYPATLGGMAITDVHPLVWIGWTAGTNAILRDPGDTAGPSTAIFNDVVSRLNKVPAGRRVLLPYYWHQDPISDQTLQVDFYKQTTDGATYSGILPLRTHETAPIKQITPWAYRQTSDAKQSFQSFLDRCISSGVTFDYIADDGESWSNPSVGSNSNVFTAPFGPTGMPASLQVTGGTNHVFAFPSWLKEPDNRMVSTYMKDSRVSTLVNPYTGLSFGKAIENKYKELLSNPTFFGNNGTLMFSFDARADLSTVGSSAAFVMDYFTREGATGISAATGPASVIQLAPPIGTNTAYINDNARNATNPWRDPWVTRMDATPNGRVSRYVGWLANRSAVEDLVMGDLYKKMWIDTIRGSTSQMHRKAKYGHYDVYPIGTTEGAFLMDYNGHTPIHTDFSHISATPVFYGEVGDSLRQAKYSTQPTDDYFKHSFILSFHQHPEGTVPFNDTQKTAFFTDQAGDIPARSYIALAKEVGILRGMLRTNPNVWKNLCPWIWNPFDLWWVGVEIPSFRADREDASIDVFSRCDTRYWNELLYHCLVSGTEYFNYFNPGATIDATPFRVPGQIGEGGFTAGITLMQGILNEWKTVSEGYRVQPCSNSSGNPSALVDRLDISAAGGNHTGATGTITSGGVILKTTGKTGDSALNMVDGKTYVWRVTAAPQGTNLFLQGGFTAELPKRINLVTGEISYGMTAGMSGATSGGFFEFTSAGGTLSYSSGTHTTLSTLVSIPNSGAGLHHTAQTVPSNELVQPFVLGDGRRTSLTFNGRQLNTVDFDGTLFNTPPVPGSRGGLTIVGFFDLAKANGLHGTNGNQFGIETAVAFVTFGGSVWDTEVTFKNQSTGQYRRYRKFLNEQVNGVFINSSFTDRTLRIDVNEDGSEARFFIDGRLVDTVTAASIAEDGNPLGAMPVGQFRGNGTWAGAAVRDISLSETPTTATNTQILLCNSMSARIIPNSTDASVTVSRRGAWIKSRRSPLMPQYKISDSNAPLPEGHLRNGGGFPATNPDDVFSADPVPGADTADLTDTSDLRAIAAWKEDPIPFYQVPPSGTVTLMAFHPSGIQKVEASLNGGQIATRTGSEGIPYQEFSFILPPLSGGSGPFINLPKTPAGVSYGGMHQIRAKIFPFVGKPRVLGGLPEESSQYYSPIAPGDPTPRKRETNETSFFLMNVANNDPKLTRFCTVRPTSSDNFPNVTPPIYKSIREAIMFELGDGLPGLCGSAKNKDFLIIQTLASVNPSNPLVFPSVGDDHDLGGVPTLLAVGFNNPENKTVIIEELDDTATRGMTFVAHSTFSGSASDNSQTSFFGVGLGSIADTWTSTTQIFGSVLPETAKAYGLSSDGLIYRLNKNPLSIYNGSTTTAPSLSNPNWAFGGTAALWTSIKDTARAGAFGGVGRVKIKGLPTARYIIDRAITPNFFTSDSTQAIRFENVEFTSTMLPSIDPKDFVRNGNVSYVNCITAAITGGLQHGFGFSRYVSGCTADGVRGRVFSNAALVLSSFATGANKSDKTNPSFFGRFVDGIAGDARSKKNSIYKDVTCSGNFADCVSMGRNESTALAADKHKIGQYDLLYSGIQMSGTFGIADRIEGNVNNVHFVGVSMPNAMILSSEYKAALDNSSLKKQKFYVDTGSRMRMVMHEGPTSGNQVALQGSNFSQNYFNGFGIQVGDPLSPSNENIVSIRPKKPGGIGVKIKGIPNKYDMLGALSSGAAPGNTWTVTFTKVHPVTGIKTFGLEMGGGFGPTAQGFTPNGLTFANWSRNTFDPVPLSPRLCWVYSANVFWPGIAGITPAAFVPADRLSYEFGISGTPSTTNAQFVSASLHTFFNASSKSDSLLFDADAPIHWMLWRTWSSDLWTAIPSVQNIAAQQNSLLFPVGSSAHWLNNGQNSNYWQTPGQNISINGTGSSPQGRLIIASVDLASQATALANALNSNSNPSLGGLTITDQFGNRFRINGGAGAFIATGRSVAVGADKIEYVDGTAAGSAWTGASVIGAFPREWIYNGDATTQYAPIKLEINVNNALIRNVIGGA